MSSIVFLHKQYILLVNRQSANRRVNVTVITDSKIPIVNLYICIF